MGAVPLHELICLRTGGRQQKTDKRATGDLLRCPLVAYEPFERALLSACAVQSTVSPKGIITCSWSAWRCAGEDQDRAGDGRVETRVEIDIDAASGRRARRPPLNPTNHTIHRTDQRQYPASLRRSYSTRGLDHRNEGASLRIDPIDEKRRRSGGNAHQCRKRRHGNLGNNPGRIRGKIQMDETGGAVDNRHVTAGRVPEQRLRGRGNGANAQGGRQKRRGNQRSDRYGNPSLHNTLSNG